MARAPVRLNAALRFALWGLVVVAGCGGRGLAQDAGRDLSRPDAADGDGRSTADGSPAADAADGGADGVGDTSVGDAADATERLDVAPDGPPPYTPPYLGSVAVRPEQSGGIYAPWEQPSVTAVGLDGAFYLAGTFGDPIDFDPGPAIDRRQAVGQGDAYLTKLEADGSRDWTLTFGGAQAHVTVYAIAVGAASIVVAGNYEGEIDLDPGPNVLAGTAREFGGAGFVSRFSLDGKLLWASTFQSTKDCVPFTVAVDATGTVYAAGGYHGVCDFDPGPGIDEETPGYGEGGFLVALTGTDGHLAWVRTYGGASCQGHVNGVAVAASGDVWATGLIGAGEGCPFAGLSVPSGDGEGTLIASFSPAGQARGAWKIGRAVAHAIAAASDGAVYVGGEALGSVDFDPGPGMARRELPGDKLFPTGFVLALRPDGGLAWVQTMANLSVGSLASLGAGGVLSLGTSPASLVPPPGFLVTRLDPAGTTAWSFRVGDPDLHAQSIAAGPSTFAVSGAAWDSDDLDPGPAIDLVPGLTTFWSRYAF